MTRPAWKDDAALLFVVLIWGVNFPVVKAALAVMHPHVVNVFRFVVSVGVLGAIYAYRRRSRSAEEPFFAPLRQYGLQIVGLGLLGHVAYQVCFIVGVNHTTAGNAALIMAASPLWTALVSRGFRYEALGRWAWVGLAVSLAGTALVVLAGAQTVGLQVGSLFGNLMMLGASFLWGAYTALNKPIVQRISPVAFAFMGILIALPVLTAIGSPYFGEVAWGEVHLWVWAALIFSGGFSTGIAYFIWSTAVKHVGASHTAVYGNLVPFVALLGGVLLLGETIAATQIIGGALIIGGLVVMRHARRSIPVEA